MSRKTFEIERVPGALVPTEDMLADIRRVAEIAKTKTVTSRLYAKLGEYDPTTLKRRFGSWNKAVLAAGLQVGRELNYSDERLFENIMHLWEHYGRQPRLAELAKPPSRISDSAYKRRFGSWMKALKQFVAYANSQEVQSPNANGRVKARRTPRDVSLRLRFRVLKRDNFSCRACGASPALRPGLLLHVDHIEPWSRGGETVEGNLQTLCEQCNLGKSNAV